jgi:hypothetical protein
LREEEPLYSLYFWEYDAFHEVVSDVASTRATRMIMIRCSIAIKMFGSVGRKTGTGSTQYLELINQNCKTNFGKSFE